MATPAVAAKVNASKPRVRMTLVLTHAVARRGYVGYSIGRMPQSVPGLRGSFSGLRGRSYRLCGALVAGLGLFACTPIQAGGAGAVDPHAAVYKGDLADQFDDAIESHALGLELDTYLDPKIDPKLHARAQAADIVARVRVTTVTGEMESGVRLYQVSFHIVERLAGKHPVGDDFTVRLDKNSPSLGIVKSLEGQLVGKPLDVFVKSFPRGDGEHDLHFHATIDSPEAAAAIRDAVILDEVK